MNVAGIIRSCQPCVSMVSKAGKPFKKRDVVLVDGSSGASLISITLTLWNSLGDMPDDYFEVGAVLTVTGAKVGEFRGRNLSSTAKSIVNVHRDAGQTEMGKKQDREVSALHAWVRGQGGISAVRSHPVQTSRGGGTRKTLGAIPEEQMGHGGRPVYCSVKATVTTVRSERAWYPACTTCSKKTVEDAAGRFACLHCKVRIDRPQNRYMVSMLITDAHTSQLVTLFDDAARVVLDKSADEAEEALQASPAVYADLFKTPLFSMYIFDLTVKHEERQEEVVDKRGKRSPVTKSFTRVSASRARKPDFVAENGLLLSKIKAFH